MIDSERHGGPGLGVQFDATGLANLADIVAHGVTVVLAAAEAHSAVEHIVAPAAVRHAGLLLVDQGVDEQVNGTLMGTSGNVRDGCEHKGYSCITGPRSKTRVEILN